MQLYIKTGSVNETTKTSGYSHFIEHLVFKKTTNYPDNQISDLVPYIGGLINAYTEFDSTCYYMMLPSEEIDKGLAILADIAFRMELTEQNISIEKDIIIEEIKQYANEPESSFIDWIQETYFKSNPLKNPVLGTIESIKQADLVSLLNFYVKNYRPENSFLVIAGDFESDDVKSNITNLFSKWSVKSKRTKDNKINYNPERNGFRFFSKSFKRNGDYLAFVIPELQEKDILSDSMLITAKAFASEKQSRLYKRLIEKDKSALEIKLHSISGLNPGITIIQVIPMSPESIQDIIYAFYDEWLNVKQSFFGNEEIELLKKEMIYSWLYDFEYIETIASSLGNEELIGSYKTLYNYPEKLNKVDTTSFTNCINKYWNLEYIAIYYQGKILPSKSIVNNLKKLFNSNNNQTNIQINDLNTTTDLNTTELMTDSNKSYSGSTSDFKAVYLDCGMHLLLRKVLNKPTICMSITTPISQLNESLLQRGVNYFTSNLLIFGTHDKTYNEIQKDCLNNGYSIKISHTLESTSLKGKCFTFNLDSMLKLASDILQYPSFPGKYLNTIKDNVIDNLRRERHTPFNHAYNNWSNLFLGKYTNLTRPFYNITKTKQINIEQIEEWYTDYFDLKNFTICITGDIDFNKVEDICNQYFKNNDIIRVKPNQKFFYRNSEQKLKIKKVNSDQSNILLGGFGCPSSDYKSNTAFFVLSQVLGGDLSSRFFNILREKYGYTYQAGFDFTSIQNLGFWLAYAICDKDDYKKVYELMLNIFLDIIRNGVTNEELISAKNYLKGLHRFEMESLSWQASTLSVLYALGYDYDYFINRENRIESVEIDVVHEIAQRWLNPENIYTYIER